MDLGHADDLRLVLDELGDRAVEVGAALLLVLHLSAGDDDPALLADLQGAAFVLAEALELVDHVAVHLIVAAADDRLNLIVDPFELDPEAACELLKNPV